MEKNYTLITGASRGIGYELAKEFAMAGHDLVLVARSLRELEVLSAELQNTYHCQVRVFSIDLSLAEAAEQVVKFLTKHQIKVDVLVNNAGLGNYGPFVDVDVKTMTQMIGVNITALTHLTRLLLPAMVDRRSGSILNIASTAAFQPGPLMAVYYATKAYVLSFSEALANELAASGIKVTAYCPGPTESGFQKAALLEGSGLFAHRQVPSSSEVARGAYKAITQGKVVAIHGKMNWIMTQTVRLAPRRLVTKVVRFIQEKR